MGTYLVLELVHCVVKESLAECLCGAPPPLNLTYTSPEEVFTADVGSFSLKINPFGSPLSFGIASLRNTGPHSKVLPL